jgi:hypothetical protein
VLTFQFGSRNHLVAGDVTAIVRCCGHVANKLSVMNENLTDNVLISIAQHSAHGCCGCSQTRSCTSTFFCRTGLSIFVVVQRFLCLIKAAVSCESSLLRYIPTCWVHTASKTAVHRSHTHTQNNTPPRSFTLPRSELTRGTAGCASKDAQEAALHGAGNR